MIAILKFAFWTLVIWGLITAASVMGYVYVGLGGVR